MKAETERRARHANLRRVSTLPAGPGATTRFDRLFAAALGGLCPRYQHDEHARHIATAYKLAASAEEFLQSMERAPK